MRILRNLLNFRQGIIEGIRDAKLLLYFYGKQAYDGLCIAVSESKVEDVSVIKQQV